MKRMVRVNELLRRELSMILELKLSEELPGLVTITKVSTSPDLRSAAVFFSLYATDKSPQDVIDILEAKRGMIQKKMAANVRLKYTPRLTFRHDDTAEKADRISQILDELVVPEEEPEAEA